MNYTIFIRIFTHFYNNTRRSRGFFLSFTPGGIFDILQKLW